MGEGPDQVVETARRIRAAVGPDVDLLIDVHKLWDPWLGVETVRRMEELDVYWLEEPVSWDDQVRGMAILSAHTRIPVVAGESECTLYACRDLVERAGIKVLQTDILSAGGYTAWRKLAALAQAFHVTVSPHGASFPELAAPLVAAVPNGLMVSAFPAGEPLEIWSRLYREPLALRDGACHLTDRPGLGLEFDEAYLAAHRA
jgi:L-alanine-DL-glutamate epimerase-like enolase superfamily enzyme